MMRPLKILMSNLGYARGIDGTLNHHIRFAHRHFYCSPHVQKQTLAQTAELIALHDPDICCFMEIDRGKETLPQSNQLEHLLTEKYPFYDIENKYGTHSLLRQLWFTKGKSNAFLAKENIVYEKHYFSTGMKRLLYQLNLAENLTLFFAHFSLNRKMRKQQLAELKEWVHATQGDVIVLGDFNILDGTQELRPLLEDESLLLLNCEKQPTFTFHKRQLMLDVAMSSANIAEHASLEVIPQPYSDHAALLLTLEQPDAARYH